MGQKVHPKSFRLSSIYTWDSSWFAEKDFAALLREDLLIKSFLKKALKNMGVAKIEIKRSGNTIDIDIHSSKPGVIIGRGGSGIEDLRKKLIAKFFPAKEGAKGKKVGKKVNLNIKEVKNPNLSAELVAQAVASDLERRIPFRRVIKQAVARVDKAGAKGVKVMVAGRLNGVEIARTEHISKGNLPLHTLRADIDYAFCPAFTIYGVIGVKVWIYKGEVFEKKNKK